MKKLIALLIVLMMMPCAVAAAEDAAGTWYFTLLTLGDYAATATETGLDMMLVLNEDGSASSITVSGLSKKETTGEWEQADMTIRVILDGEERTGVFNDGCIILGSDANDKVLTFSRIAPLGTYYTPAAPKAAVLADYLGEWECRFAAIGTRVIPLSTIDSAAEITVTPLMAGVYIRNTADDESTKNLNVTVADGALLIGPENAPEYTVQLLEDGVAMCALDSGVTYYFERVAE